MGGSKPIFQRLEDARRFLTNNDWENTSDLQLSKKIGCSSSIICRYRIKLGFLRTEVKSLEKTKTSTKELQRLERDIQKTILRNKLQKEMKLKLKEKYGIFKI